MLAALIVAAALNQPVATQPVIAETPVICRNVQGPGTRLTARVCMTEADWSARKAAMNEHRIRTRPKIDNRRPRRGIGRW